MTKQEQYALVLSLMDALHDNKSWCGETRIQKNMYLLHELKRVEADWDFVLYKYGPYSFELHDNLEEMSFLELIEGKSQKYYGPRLFLTDKGKGFMKKHFPEKEDTKNAVTETARIYGPNNVQALEKCATAIFL